MIGGSSLFLIFLVFLAGCALARYLRPVIALFVKRISQAYCPEGLRPYLLKQPQTAYSLLILWAVCRIGFPFASVEDQWRAFLYQPLKVILAYSLLLISWQFLDLLEKLFILNLESEKSARRPADSVTKHLLPYAKKILKTLFAVIAGLMLLQNSGFNVTSLLAGLGIGGIAIALAAKETLGNFFGGVTVVLDKPFSAGDWIVCDKFEGTVEDIGFRSTKVKTFYDSLLTIPNSVISESIIDNLGKRQARRTRAVLDITYDTPPEKIEAFVEGIKNIIQSNSYTRKDYYQCYFSDYGPHSLQILLNFFLKAPDWDTELLQKQNIFLEILRLAKELEIDFAFPTQTLDVPSLPGQEKKAKQKISKEALWKKALAFGPGGELASPQSLRHPKK